MLLEELLGKKVGLPSVMEKTTRERLMVPYVAHDSSRGSSGFSDS